MLAPYYAIAQRNSSLVFTGAHGLTDVVARVYDADGEEVTGSPVECSEVTPGVYAGTLRIDDTGTYLIRWTGDSGGIQEVQNLLVVLSVHAVTIHVQDEDTGAAFPGLRLMLVKFTQEGHALYSETITDQDGEAVLEVPEGRYRICLQEAGCVFTENAFPLEVDYTDEEMPVLIEVLKIAVPASGYTPPESTVTMTARLIDVMGNPMRFRGVHITLLTPTRYTSGSSFIVAEDRKTEKTDSDGHLSVVLIPGTEVEVSVENTGITRRFTVPQDDFDLFDYLGASDLFDVQNPLYASAKKTT
jgi:hypothetical protein